MCRGGNAGFKRDFNQALTSLWRIFKTIKKRKMKLHSILFPAGISLIFFILGATQYDPVKYKLTATDEEYTFVTSSTPNAEDNYFYDASSGLSTSLELRNCTLR